MPFVISFTIRIPKSAELLRMRRVKRGNETTSPGETNNHVDGEKYEEE